MDLSFSGVCVRSAEKVVQDMKYVYVASHDPGVEEMHPSAPGPQYANDETTDTDWPALPGQEDDRDSARLSPCFENGGRGMYVLICGFFGIQSQQPLCLIFAHCFDLRHHEPLNFSRQCCNCWTIEQAQKGQHLYGKFLAG